MKCGGTQTRRQQERRGTPRKGVLQRGALGPAPLLPSPGLRSDLAQFNKCSPKSYLPRHQSLGGMGEHDSGAWVSMTFGELLESAWVSMTFDELLLH